MKKTLKLLTATALLVSLCAPIAACTQNTQKLIESESIVSTRLTQNIFWTNGYSSEILASDSLGNLIIKDASAPY